MVFEKVLQDMVTYLTVVHDIRLNMVEDTWIDELEFYVRDLNDDILQDAWRRYIAESHNSAHHFERHFNAFRAKFRQQGGVIRPFYATPKSIRLNHGRRLKREAVHLSWY